LRLRQFIADASHELRTPLATIKANAEYLARPDVDAASDEGPRAVSRITAAAERMGSLVADLLLLARLDAGRPLEQNDVDLTRLVLESVSDARAAYPDHSWQLQIADEIVIVAGDEQRLHQVLANVLTNAGIHTPPGTAVTTVLTAEPHVAVVDVIDDGPGISPLRQRDLFDRFTRGDTSRSREHGSTGLGLAIARSIATAHGGTLTLIGGTGAGAHFRVTLPRKSDPGEPSEPMRQRVVEMPSRSP
jgi:two-component system OmpR family sensor kinase